MWPLREIADDPAELARNGKNLRLSEKAINQYLAKIVQGKQKWLPEKQLAFKGVALNLLNDECEVLIEREFLGRRSSQILRFRFVKEGGEIIIEPTGGSYGLLPVPGKFALVGKAAYRELVRVMALEIELCFKSGGVHFREGELNLGYLPPE